MNLQKPRERGYRTQKHDFGLPRQHRRYSHPYDSVCPSGRLKEGRFPLLGGPCRVSVTFPGSTLDSTPKKGVGLCY